MTDNTSQDDIAIVTRVIAGDKDAFGGLIDCYEKPLQFYCLRLLNFHAQDAEDAVANTFVKAYQNIASYNSNNKFSSWIYRIAHNEAISLWRKRQGFFNVDLSDMWYVPAPDSDKSKEINSKNLDEVMKQLCLSDREVLTLFHLEEKSLAEISDILKLTTNTVAVRLKRARARAQQISSKLGYV